MRITAAKGTGGIVATMVGFTVSQLNGIEQWLRIVSLIGGIIVAIVTIWSIIRKWNKS